jgi:hypothetical protein
VSSRLVATGVSLFLTRFLRHDDHNDDRNRETDSGDATDHQKADNQDGS